VSYEKRGSGRRSVGNGGLPNEQWGAPAKELKKKIWGKLPLKMIWGPMAGEELGRERF